MDDLGQAAALMQVIDVLRDQRDLTLGSQSGQRGMGRVGFGSEQVLTAGVIEIQYELRIAAIPLRGCNVLKIVLRPETISITERPQTGFSRRSRPCQKNDQCCSLRRNISTSSRMLGSSLQSWITRFTPCMIVV